MKKVVQFSPLILILLITALIAGCKPITTYENESVPVTFSYLSNWQFGEGPAGFIDIRNPNIAGMGVYLQVDKTETFEGNIPVEILGNLLADWEEKDSGNNFSIEQPPEMITQYGYDMARSTSRSSIPLFVNSTGGEVSLATDYFQEVYVISEGRYTAVIMLRSRGNELNPKINTQADIILNSLVFTD